MISYLEKYTNDPNSDLSSSAIIKHKDKYCFVIQPEARWGTNDDGNILVPFGGIGGKLEEGESPVDAVIREAVEEIGTKIELMDSGNTVYIISPEGIVEEPFASDNKAVNPLYIFRNPRSEKGRKPYTNVFVYGAKIIKSDLPRQIENPGIINMDEGLLLDTVSGKVTIGQALSRGMDVESNIILPNNAILAATPTPRGMVRCLREIVGFRKRLNDLLI